MFEKIIKDTFQEFDRYKSLSVKGSMPILFFGDYEEYSKSKTKIVTVAINPSNIEFGKLEKKTFKRIIDYRFNLIHEVKTQSQQKEYINSLSNYFKFNPYCSWFNNFEKLLQKLNSSYYGNDYPKNCTPIENWKKRDNRVLHTDICSPIATEDKWSKLSDDNQDFLSKNGKTIWDDLIKILKPDLIIISGGKYMAEKINFEVLWKSIKLPKEFDKSHKMMTSNYNGITTFWISGKNTPVSMQDEQLDKIADLVKKNK